MPMFPLGSVLFPTAVLPLHVFEPRYRQLTADCLAGDHEFGVVLIERGSEVGGQDVRTDVGTVARIVESAEFADGRWALGTVGVRRVRVTRWLADDPYPRAEVTDWPDPAIDRDVAGLHDGVVRQLRRSLALASEAGDTAAPATLELNDDPAVASHQASFLAPLGPIDKQQLLAAPDAVERLELLDRMLGDAIGLLEARLAMD